MKTSIQKGETQRLHIEAEWDEIADDYKDVVSAYLQLPIPGFRQGHAPKDMVERHFARQIRQDFAKQCGERLCRRALQEQNVTPAGPLEITTYHVEAGVQFVFQAEFEASPEIQLPDLETVPLQGETEAERRDEITAWLLATTGVSVSRRLVEWELTFDEQPQAAAGSAAWEAAANRVKLMNSRL